MEIPVLLYDRTAGTHEGSACREREDRCKRSRRRAGKAVLRSRRREAERKRVAKRAGFVPRKAAIDHKAPVPQTDTGGWGENPEAGGRSIVKELGKKAP